MIVGEAQRQLAAAKEVPLLRLHHALGLPYWAMGIACGLPVFALLYIPGQLFLPPEALRETTGVALFFSTTITIIATFTVPVFRGAAMDLKSLAPIIPLSEDQIECLALGLTRATRGQLTKALIGSVLTGLLHSYVLGHQYLPLGFMIPQVIATTGLWVVMMPTLSKMVINAALFSRLGKMADPDLLRPSAQAPFGAASVRPTLFLIGTLCTYPLLAVGDGNPLNDGVWLGVVASLASIVGIVSLPLRGIRQRIRARRVEILRTLDDRLEAISNRDLGTVEAETLRDMDTILDMRERVAQAPAWPLDLAGVQRILLYIVLPPLTWAAAALVEMLIDNAI